MAKRKKRSTSSTRKKRTISPEHLAKMQEGRKRKAEMERREKVVRDKGLMMEAPETNASRIVRTMRRQG